jgi:hypothetical protein
MIRNPYDSPRVLRAVLEEICEFIRFFAETHPGLLDMDAELQHLANEFTTMVAWRGSSLRKLIAIDCYMKPDGTNEILFKMRPISEDGRWLCRQMDLIEAPLVELPKVPEFSPVAPKMKITRIVEV